MWLGRESAGGQRRRIAAGDGTRGAAAADRLIPFQARLTDGAGAPLEDEVYRVEVRLYDTATGGSPLNGWVEVHESVSVIGGVLNVLLGSMTPFSDPDEDGNDADAIAFLEGDGRRYLGYR